MRASFDNWLQDVIRLFQQDYCLSLADIGAEHTNYLVAYEQGISATEYVATFARKYDLTHIDDVMLHG